MEMTLRQAGYTLEEINKMSDYLAFHRFLVAQRLMNSESDQTPYIPPPTPPPSPSRGVRRSPSGSSYNFPV